MEKNIEMIIVKKSFAHSDAPIEEVKEEIYVRKFYFYPHLFKMISKMILSPLFILLFIVILIFFSYAWMRDAGCGMRDTGRV